MALLGVPTSFFDREIELIEVGLTPPLSLYLYKVRLLELLQMANDAALPDTHIHRERLLARKAKVVLPRVAQQNRVREFCAR